MKPAINFWWVTRPKRRLESVPLILSEVVVSFLNAQWGGARDKHLAFEEALESSKLKRTGQRRDHTGGGARTYIVWLKSLGLLFEDADRNLNLTLAGEALLNNSSPVEVLTNQVIKYQFPSSFSTHNSPVDQRFSVHPFVFLLRLLADPQIGCLTQEEIAKIVITHGESDSERCFDYVKKLLLDFRASGDSILESDFFDKYNGGKKSFAKLEDAANTMINWMEFTRLAQRDENKKLVLLEQSRDKIQKILANPPKLIQNWQNEEIFQRRYGLDPGHSKDTRNLKKTQTITPDMIETAAIRQQFMQISADRLILNVDDDLIKLISDKSGYTPEKVEKRLSSMFPNGGIRQFMPKLYDMAYSGTEKAAEFEKATAEIFSKEFKFEAKHVGPIGLTPDVLVWSDNAGYCGIIDNKAYSQYSITNDHHNRMVHNYIGNLSNYYKGSYRLRFFSYIAGGFCRNIGGQLSKITKETGISGSALNVENFIRLIEKNRQSPISHQKLGELFSCGRQILSADF